ncbi:MAG: transcription antitermination factor NusB [Terracidiphilus sp.]
MKQQSGVSPARRAAFDALLAVEAGKAHSDDLLRARRMDALAPADRNLATALVLGVLRWQIPLDAAIRPLLTRPGARLDPEIRIALRLAAFQILHMDRIPARAAIGESVELAKQAGHRFAAGMVNAVLRKLAAAPVRTAEAAQAYPVWMVERWTRFYGAEAAEAICRHGQSQPELAVRLASAETETELAAAGIELAPGALLAAARTVLSGEIMATAAFREGRVRVQDEGSQLVGELAAASTGHSVERILDACAAPGGKTLILAERNPQARIVACEASQQRHATLAKRLSELAGRVECRLADATTLAEEGVYDLVLVDAPCSGTGTLGRNPEIRHGLGVEDLGRQAERQRALLAAALGALRPGGRVVYSTCSLEPEENEQVIEAALASAPHARLFSLGDRIGALARSGVLVPGAEERLRAYLTAEGFLRLLPGCLPTDGFFVAAMERTA